MALADKLDNLGVAVHHEVRVLVDLVLEEARCGELGLSLDDPDALREPGQEHSFLERRVSATDDQKLLGPAIERAVACGAEMDAGADEVVLAGDAEAPV